MAQYTYRKEEVTIKVSQGARKPLPAFIPAHHSTLKALVYPTENIPTNDFLVETYTWCYARYKDNPRWKKIYEGHKKNNQIPNLEQGWHDIHKV